MLTILTVTKRNGWFAETAESLMNQTIKQFKWVIVYEPNVDVVDIDGLDVKWVPAPKKTRHSNLSASNNEGLRHVGGELVMFLQDFIPLPNDAVEKLIKDCQSTNAFITTATINPDGNYDARYTGMNGLRKIEPKEWEENVAIAPMQAFYDLGGYDEEYDKGWAWNNNNVAERAELLGYEFYIDESVQPKLTFHPKEPDVDKTLELNYMRHEMTMRQIAIGQKPIKLSYL